MIHEYFALFVGMAWIWMMYDGLMDCWGLGMMG